MTDKYLIQGQHFTRETLASHCAKKLNGAPSNFKRGIWEFILFWLGEDESFIMRTSGSTGESKEFAISKRWMESSAETTAMALGIKPEMKAFLCIPSRYTGGLMMIARSLHLGLDLYFQEPSSRPSPNDNMDFTALVPLQLETLLSEKNSLSKLGVMIIGGAPISAQLSEKIKDLSYPIYATYGMTETVSHVALKRMTGDSRSSAFHTLPGVSISSDKEGRLNIQVSHFDNHLIQTNDIVEIMDCNSFKWIGRADNIINSGGIKIRPEELEALIAPLLPLPFFIHKKEHKRLGQQTVLCIEGNVEHTEKELLDSVRKACGQRRSPKEIYQYTSFIRTETGKIMRDVTFNSGGKRLPYKP